MTLPTPEALGNEFFSRLTDILSEYEMSEVKRLNALPDYKFSCASHDFNDSNMVMLAAFEDLAECEFDLDNQAHVDLFNAAWDYAKINHLTEKA